MIVLFCGLFVLHDLALIGWGVSILGVLVPLPVSDVSLRSSIGHRMPSRHRWFVTTRGGVMWTQGGGEREERA